MPNPVNYYIQTNPVSLPINSVWSSYSDISNPISTTAIIMEIYGNEGYSVSMEDFTIGGLQPSYIGPSTVEDIPNIVETREWVNLSSSTGEPPLIELPTGVDKVVMIDAVASGDPNNFIVVYAYLNSDYEIGEQNIEIILDIDGDATETDPSEQPEWDDSFNINVVMASGADSHCKILTRITSNIQSLSPSLIDNNQAINYPWVLEAQTDDIGNSTLEPWHARITCNSSEAPGNMPLYDSPTPYVNVCAANNCSWYWCLLDNEVGCPGNAYGPGTQSYGAGGGSSGQGFNTEHIVFAPSIASGSNIFGGSMGEYSPGNISRYRPNNYDKSTVYWFRIVPEEGYTVCRYNFSVAVSSELYSTSAGVNEDGQATSTPQTGPTWLSNRRWNNTIDFGYPFTPYYSGWGFGNWIATQVEAGEEIIAGSTTNIGVEYGVNGNHCPQWNTLFGWNDPTPFTEVQPNMAYPDWGNYWWDEALVNSLFSVGDGIYNGTGLSNPGINYIGTSIEDDMMAWAGPWNIDVLWQGTNCQFPYSQVPVPGIHDPANPFWYTIASEIDQIEGYYIDMYSLVQSLSDTDSVYEDAGGITTQPWDYWKRGAVMFANVLATFTWQEQPPYQSFDEYPYSETNIWPSNHPLGGIFLVDRNNVLPPAQEGLQWFLDSQSLTPIAINNSGLNQDIANLLGLDNASYIDENGEQQTLDYTITPGGAAIYDPWAFFQAQYNPGGLLSDLGGFDIDDWNGAYNGIVLPTANQLVDPNQEAQSQSQFAYENLITNISGSSYYGLTPLDFTGNEVIIGITGLNEYIPGNFPADITFYIHGAAMEVDDETLPVPFTIEVDIMSDQTIAALGYI